MILNRVLSLGFDYQLRVTDIEIFLGALRTARMDNLPLEPCMGKIEEGLAKRICTGAITQALERKIDDYRFVQTLIPGVVPEGAGKSFSEADLTILGDSLSSGVSRQKLAGFIELAPPAPLPMLAIAVENLALLKQIGFDEGLAEQILFTGLRLKRFTPSWRYLARVIVVARNKGITDRDITQAAGVVPAAAANRISVSQRTDCWFGASRPLFFESDFFEPPACQPEEDVSACP